MSRAIVAGINSQYDMDLIDMVAIDIFSCFAHCQPIKSKKGVNAVLKSQNIFRFYALNTKNKVNYAERLIKTF